VTERGAPRAAAARRTALAIYAASTALFALTAARGIFTEHTPFNHFALLAEAWLDGRLDLGAPPPEYTGYNDFAVFEERFYVSFPPLPAVLLLPVVALRGGAEHVKDGLFFLGLAGFTPSVLFLALERLRAFGLSRRGLGENAALSVLFALGTVYWFTAVQGTVWFAAHVVGAALAAGYLWASIGAASPLAAGLLLGLAAATRTPLLFAAPLFVLELTRTGSADVAERGRQLLRFLAPLGVVLCLLAWHNAARFGDPTEFGHRHLDVVWRPRFDKWGLFSLHYLGKNLGVMLASTPFFGSKDVPFQVSGHGLALWITSPFLLWALWPQALAKKGRLLFRALAITSAAVAMPSLLYQNTGWIQFGYRFSNDFSVFLVAMIALGRRRLGAIFWLLAAVSVVVNAFGAVSFQRPGWEKWYAFERTQRVIFEPD
jgi:hypothetical protein